LKAISDGVNFYEYVKNDSINFIDPTGLSPDFRLVPISDCSSPGYRRIVYQLQGPGASKWWVTEHQNPKSWAAAAPSMNSPEGQSTGDENNGPGGFDDTIFGFNTGNSYQTFTISPEDPRKNPNTPSCSVNVQLPSGPNGRPQDYGTLGIYHGGSKGFNFINGNSTGWVPCSSSYQ
jgi:hypothetical protein